MQIWKTFLIAFSALLPMVNPAGSAMQLFDLVGEAPPELYRNLARRIALNNIIFLAIVELSGAAILRFFGISLPIIEISGGMVISSLGWATLNQPDSGTEAKEAQEGESKKIETSQSKYFERVFYPFTFPVTSGPATMVTLITLSAHVAPSTYTDSALAHLAIFIAVVVISACVYGCYAYAPRLATAVAPGTLHGILRIISFITFSIGIQIAWKGLSTLMLRH